MRKLLRVVAVLVAVVGFTLAPIGQVAAQSNALAIQPRKDYNLKAGESVEDTLTITNRHQTDPLNLSLSVIDFEARDESGSAKLLKNRTERTAWSIKNFTEIPEQVTVNPGETTRIPVRITVPEGTGAGSYYSAIEYAATGGQSGDQVNIAASGVSLIFVKVPGLAKQQLTLLQFGTYAPDAGGRTGSFRGLFFGTRPKSVAYRLRNDGNIAEQAVASVVIKDFSGNTVYEIGDANPKKQLALRGQTRLFDVCINQEDVVQTTETGQDITATVCGDTEKFKPGRYTAEISIIYGENGNQSVELTEKAAFWYLPWWFVGLIFAALLVLVAAFFWVKRKLSDVRSRKTRRR